MAKRVTMREIGQAVGVSTVTVSKAMAGKDGVSEAVREKIIRTAREMGYVRPEAAARTAPEESIVGIFTAERHFSSGSFYAMLYKEIVKEMMEHDMLGLFEVIPDEQEAKLALPSLLEDEKINAIIVLGQFSPEYVLALKASGLPMVLVDFYSDTLDVDSIVSDGQTGSMQLTQYLIRRGHRRIGFIGSFDATSSITNRYFGYLQGLMTCGIRPDNSLVVEDRDARNMYLQELTLPNPLPTAFVCENDEIAMKLVRQLKGRGLAVPDDLSVTGFDNFIYATICRPQLTTINVDMQRMAQIAIHRLQIRMGGSTEGAIRCVIPGRLIERDSVAAPKK